VPKFFTGYRDLLALPEVAMIDLCLPNHLHRPVADVWGLTLLIQLGAGIGILSALLALFLPKTGAVISSAAAKSVPA
jgi:predicted dehydrogenase